MRYVLGTVGMLLLLIFAVVLFARMGDRQNQTNNEQGQTTVNITDYANDKSVVEFEQYGAVVSDENRRSLKISVSEKERTIQVYEGYEQAVINSQTLDNNSQAYSAFLNALKGAGFTNSQETSVSNPESVCSQGRRFVYVLNSEGSEVSNLWNNSCRPLDGTLANNGNLIRALFQEQIPNYNDLVKGVQF